MNGVAYEVKVAARNTPGKAPANTPVIKPAGLPPTRSLKWGHLRLIVLNNGSKSCAAYKGALVFRIPHFSVRALCFLAVALAPSLVVAQTSGSPVSCHNGITDYVVAFKAVADFNTDDPTLRWLCVTGSDIDKDTMDDTTYASSSNLTYTDASGVAAEKITVEEIRLSEGYLLMVFDERSFRGASRIYRQSAERVDGLISSYVARSDPCSSDSVSKAVLWDQERFRGLQAHCVTRDEPGLPSSVWMRSAQVEAGYKLVLFTGSSYSGDAKVLHGTDMDLGDGDRDFFDVRSYLLIPSVALESAEQTEEGVVLSYSPLGSARSSVTIQSPLFRVVEGVKDGAKEYTLQYSRTGKEADLLALATISNGSDGRDGADGRNGVTPQLERNDSHIQYSRDEGKSWENLVALEELKGERGEKGDKGDTSEKGDPGSVRAVSFGTEGTCDQTSQGSVHYDSGSSELLVCDGLNWISFAKTGSRPGFLSVEALGSANSHRGDYACALLSGGSVECWGWNRYSQLNKEEGRGLSLNTMLNEVARRSTQVRQIATGERHACVLLSGDEVECWGSNTQGQLNKPGDLGEVHQLVAGSNHTCALLSDGNVECWGDNEYGQLNKEEGKTSQYAVLSSTKNWSAQAIQLSAGHNHTCAVLSDGNFECWGTNQRGQLNKTEKREYYYHVVLSPAGKLRNKVRQIAAGREYTCALLSDGTVECWGNNYYSHLNKTTRAHDNYRTTNDAAGLNGQVRQISSGSGHTCALLSDGTVECWGHIRGAIPNGTGNVRQISLGHRHSCALFSNGKVECWGERWGNSQSGGGFIPMDQLPENLAPASRI